MGFAYFDHRLYSQAESGLPTEDEQCQEYQFLAGMAGEQGAVIRTLELTAAPDPSCVATAFFK